MGALLKKALIGALSVVMLAEVLAFGGIGTSLTASATEVKNVDSDNPYRLKQVWVWHRVKKQGDIPDYVSNGNNLYPIILADQSGRYYTGYGKQYDDDDDSWSWYANDWSTQNGWFGSLTGSSTFITPYLPTTWYLEVTDTKDSKNQNAKKGIFWHISGDTWYNIYAKSDDDLWIASGKRDLWTLYTSELGGSYAKDLDSDKLHIYYETGGRDPQFKISGRWLWGEPDKDYNDGGEFILWWGEVRNLSCVDNHLTIQTGDVMNVDSGVMFQPVVNTTSGYQDVVITVEPGAVLSVEGVLYNNATIYNYGTVIVQKNSAILSFFPHDKNNNYKESYGKIICDGGTYVKNGQRIQGEGNLILMEGAKIDLNRANELFVLKNGATAEINGVITAPGSIVVQDSELYIRNKGAILCGVGRSDRSNQEIATAQVQNAGKPGVNLKGITLETVNGNNGTAIYTTSGSKITCDGYLKVNHGNICIREGSYSRPMAVNSGSGTVSTPSYMSKDANGNSYYTETVNGQTITYTYYSNTSDLVYTMVNATTGVTVYYYRNEAVKTVQKDGSYEYRFPQGDAFVVSSITYKAGSSTKDAVYFDGVKETVPVGTNDLDLAYGDITALAANGIEKIETMDDGSVVTTYLNGDIYTVLGQSWLWQHQKANNDTYFTERYTAASQEYENHTWDEVVEIRNPNFERTTYPASVSDVMEVYKDLATGQITTTYQNGDKKVEEKDGSYYMVYTSGIYEQKYANGVIHTWKYGTVKEEGQEPELTMNIWKNSKGWYITPAEGQGKEVKGYAQSGEEACFEVAYKALEGSSDVKGYSYLTNYIPLSNGSTATFSDAVWYSKYEDGTWSFERRDGVEITFRTEGTSDIPDPDSIKNSLQQTGLRLNEFYENPNGEIYLSALDIHVPAQYTVVRNLGRSVRGTKEVYAIDLDVNRTDSIFSVRHVLTLTASGDYIRKMGLTENDLKNLYQETVDSLSKPSETHSVVYKFGTVTELAPEFYPFTATGILPGSTVLPVGQDPGIMIPEAEKNSEVFAATDPVFLWAVRGPAYPQTIEDFLAYGAVRRTQLKNDSSYSWNEMLVYVENGYGAQFRGNLTREAAGELYQSYMNPELMVYLYGEYVDAAKSNGKDPTRRMTMMYLSMRVRLDDFLGADPDEWRYQDW